MKKKISTPQAATKSDIKNLLKHQDKRFITLEKRLDKRFDSIDKRSESTDKLIIVLEKAIRLEIRLTAGEIIEKTEKKISNARDYLLTTFNPLLEEIEARRMEREENTDKRLAMQDNITKLERRVTNLEQTALPV